MSNHAVQKLTSCKKVMVAVAGMLAVAVPVAVGVMNAAPQFMPNQPCSAPKASIQPSKWPQ